MTRDVRIPGKAVEGRRGLWEQLGGVLETAPLSQIVYLY